MYSRFRSAISALMVVAPALVSAQDQPNREEEENRRPIGAVGGSFSYGRPVGDFLRYVHEGIGGDAFFRWNADPQGVFSLKLDGGFLLYGSETKRVPLSTTVGGRILVDLTTNNNIAWMGFGPQLTFPTGSFRPYANASIGFSYFWTQSSVEGSDDTFDFANTTNFSDAAFRYGFGWGVLIPFQSGTTEWAIDMGAIYHGNGQVLYLREGGIEDLPGGEIRLHPIRSDANLLTYRLGVSFTLK